VEISVFKVSVRFLGQDRVFFGYLLPQMSTAMKLLDITMLVSFINREIRTIGGNGSESVIVVFQKGVTRVTPASLPEECYTPLSREEEREVWRLILTNAASSWGRVSPPS